MRRTRGTARSRHARAKLARHADELRLGLRNGVSYPLKPTKRMLRNITSAWWGHENQLALQKGQIMAKPLVIYHADCTDGYGAAFATWLKLGDNAKYVPMNYNTIKEPANPSFGDAFAERGVILDFSCLVKRWTGCSPKPSVVWLDHHKTAFEMMVPGRSRMKRRLHLRRQRPHLITLDDNKSGALLAWEYFHPGTESSYADPAHRRPRPLAVEAGRLGRTACCAEFIANPWSFEQLKHLFEQVKTPKWAQMFEAEGSAILRAQKQHVEQMAKQARKCWIEPFDRKANLHVLVDIGPSRTRRQRVTVSIGDRP